jgi:hypothetical protein
MEISTSMRAGRSLRAQTTAPVAVTSPPWIPWVMLGRPDRTRLKGGEQAGADGSRPDGSHSFQELAAVERARWQRGFGHVGTLLEIGNRP